MAIYGSTYSDAGLRWTIHEVLEAEALLSETGNHHIQGYCCSYCKTFLEAEDLQTLRHQPGYRALRDSATRCLLCFELISSINTSITPLMRERGRSENDGLRSLEKVVDEIKIVSLPLGQGDSSKRCYVTWSSSGEFVFVGVVAGLCKYLDADASQEAIWTSSDSNNFDTRFPTIDRWIRQCLNHHGSCAHSTTPLLPKRILDVGTEDQNTMRLIASGDRRAHYIALSHCWGTAAPLTTTKATLSSRMSRIEMSDLPKLFQETVRVVQHLRIRYLWIDTLSIIQDDTKDWETEAAKMCQIYQDAFLTIAASAAEDCNSELICPFVPSSRGTYQNEDPLRFAVRVSDIHSPNYLEPLDTRGWALQEDLLSRRMLYFGDGQFSWHCREVIASEDGLLDGLDVGDSMLSRMRQNFKKVLNAEKPEVQLIWRRLVEAYSVRDLTFRSDKLSALAGLTVFFQNLLGEAPILGLWRDDIFAGLLWTTEHGATRPSSPLSQDIPSWSWMSIDGHVSYDDPWTWSTGDPANTTQKFRTVPAAEIHSSPVQWSGQPLSSRPLPNSLTVHGSLMLVSLTYHDYLRSKRSVLIRIDNNSTNIHEAAKGWGTLDVPIDALPQDAHCLHVADVIPQADDSISDGSHMGLLVRPVGQKPNTYSRIGLLGLPILCDGQSQGDRADNALPFSTRFPEAKVVTITLV